MFWKVLSAMMCLALVAAALSWYGPFHAVVGLPVLIVCVLLWKMLRGRLADAEQDLDVEVDKDEPGVVHGVCMGLITGAVAVGMLAGAFSLATAVGMRDLVEGPDCRAVLQEVAILNQEKSYAGVLRRLHEALQQRWGAACQHTLRMANVEALLGQAEQMPDAERLTHLEHTWQVASTVQDTRLQQLVQSKLDAEQQRRAAEAKRREAEQQTKALEQQAQADATIIRKLQEQNAQLSADLKALDIPVARTADGIKLTLTENVLRFASGEATLDDQARASLKRIASVLEHEAYRHRRVRVIGHTDTRGNNHLVLSTARAQSVADELSKHGVRRERLTVEGRGDQQPVSENSTAEGRSRNRRVEILLVDGQA